MKPWHRFLSRACKKLCKNCFWHLKRIYLDSMCQAWRLPNLRNYRLPFISPEMHCMVPLEWAFLILQRALDWVSLLDSRLGSVCTAWPRAGLLSTGSLNSLSLKGKVWIGYSLNSFSFLSKDGKTQDLDSGGLGFESSPAPPLGYMAPLWLRKAQGGRSSGRNSVSARTGL